MKRRHFLALVGTASAMLIGSRALAHPLSVFEHVHQKIGNAFTRAHSLKTVEIEDFDWIDEISILSPPSSNPLFLDRDLTQ